MSLTDQQMELLHAWVDGETAAAESETARELVARDDDARVYVDELRRLRELLRAHSCVPAPHGLRERVCVALRSEFAAPVIPLPRRSWGTLAAAAAAVVVVSLVAVFGINVLDRQQQASQVAQGARADAKAATPQPQYSPAGDLLDEKPASKEAKGKESKKEAEEDYYGGDATSGANVKGAGSSTDKRHSGAVTKDERKEGNPPPASGAPGAPVKYHNAGKGGSTVFVLDRGVNQPLELGVNMDRGRNASALQVCNDMLVVSSLYGDAHITDHESTGNVTENVEEEFDGNDFSDFDGVEVELDSDRVPGLIAALDRLAADQHYGRVIAPSDLRPSIAEALQTIDEMKEFTRRVEDLASPNAQHAADKRNGSGAGQLRGYMPARLQRECARRDVRAMAGPDATDGPKPANKSREVAEKQPGAAAESQGRSHKVKLLIHLR